MKAFKRKRWLRLNSYKKENLRRKLYWKVIFAGKSWWVSRNRNCMKEE